MSIPITPTVVDAAALADELARFHIVPSDRLSELLSDFSGGGPAGLAEFLVTRRALTPFQAERALAGETPFLAPGPYRLSAVLRHGTLGAVFRATHTSKPGTFAVKLLPLRSLWQAKQAKQLVRSLGRFASHHGIVPLIDADSANGFHYLVWPATEEEPLADRVASSGPLPPVEAAAMLADLAEALAACHARNVPHGALSPRAVGLDSNGGARLLDLGLGALLAQNLAADESLFDTLSTALTVTGMLDYAAPELVADPTQPSPIADLFSLGAVGFFALTGQVPYQEDKLSDRLLARQMGYTALVREVNPHVSVELAQVIDRLLQPNPAERFSGADEARELLAAAAEQLDQSRPVLVGRGSAPLAEQHRSDPVNEGHARNTAPVEAGRRSGSVSSAGSGVARPPERDGSDASITFDLPPDASNDCPIRPLEAVETPRLSLGETRPDCPSLSRKRMLDAGSPPRSTHASLSTSSPLVAPPDSEESPDPSDDSTMAKTSLPDPFDGTALSPLPLLPTTPPPLDPRLVLPAPVQWHTGHEGDPGAPAPTTTPDPVPMNSVLWKKVKRNLLFWQPPTDPVAVSVFGPASATPGKTIRVTVFLHHPESIDSVHTLSRAFQHDAELIGSGHAAREVARESLVAVHLSIMNAAATRSMMETIWRGQPLRLNFDLHVPWESPPGQAPGLVSIGLANVRIGKAAFTLNISPRGG